MYLISKKFSLFKYINNKYNNYNKFVIWNCIINTINSICIKCILLIKIDIIMNKKKINKLCSISIISKQ